MARSGSPYTPAAMLMVEPGLVVLALLAVAAVVTIVARRAARGSGVAADGDPSAAAVPETRTDVRTDVRALLQRLADPDTRDDAADALVARGADVVPDLIAAIADLDAPWRPHAIRVLGWIGDVRACAILRTLVSRGDRAADDAAFALASLGAAEAIPILVDVLGHPLRAPAGEAGEPDDRAALRHQVFEGVVWAAENGRLTPESRDALVAPVAALVGASSAPTEATAARALLALDPEAARHVLLSPDVLGRGASAVRESLDALLDAGVAVDPDLAWKLAAALPVRAAESDREGDTLRVVLCTLARSGHPGARARIDGCLALPDERTHRAAVEALGVLAGIEDPDELVDARHAEAGFDGLSPAQRTWRLVRRYVGTGGHAEWFEGEGGSRSAETVAALREIGADAAADVLSEACGRFTGGVPSDPGERRERLARASADGAVPFSDLDERLYEAASSAEDRLAEFAVAHAAEFRDDGPSDG